MSKVTDELRLAVRNLIDEGFSTKEIAEKLDQPVGRINSIKAHITMGRYKDDGTSSEEKYSKPTNPKSKDPDWPDKISMLKGPPKDCPNRPLIPGSSIEDTGDNQATLSYNGDRIPKSIPQLLKWCSVDPEIWKVLRSVVNMWTVTMKSDKEGGGITHPNWQIKAFLIRKEPIELQFPEVKPISINLLGRITTKTPSKAKVKTALLFGDSQVGFRKDHLTNDMQPFHDRKCLDVIAQVNAYLQPDMRIYLGDMLDFAPWSDKFKQEIGFTETTQPSLSEWVWWLGQYETIPAAESYWLEGNHEVRMVTSMLKHKAEARSLHTIGKDLKIKISDPYSLSVPGLLPLEHLGIVYKGEYPKGEVWINDNLHVTHGSTVRAKSGKSVEAIVNDARATEIVGHTHRLESAHKTVHRINGPVTYGAFSMGTTARIDDAVPAAGVRQNWQQGFGMVKYTDDGYFHVSQYVVNDGKVLFDGKLFEASDQKQLIKTISDATGIDFNRKK